MRPVMLPPHHNSRWGCGVATLFMLGTSPGVAQASPALGSIISNAKLGSLQGGPTQALLGAQGVSVVVFLRPAQAYSNQVLGSLPALEADLAGKPVHFVTLISGQSTATAALAWVKGAALRMPVLLDVGDLVAAQFHLVQHPAVAVLDAEKKVTAFVPFSSQRFAATVKAHILHALGELSDLELEARLSPVTEAAVEHGTMAARLHLRLAKRLLSTHNPQKAEASARTAVEKDATLVEAHVVLGDALAAQGNCKAALTAYAGALALEPTLPAALQGQTQCGVQQAPTPPTATVQPATAPKQRERKSR